MLLNLSCFYEPSSTLTNKLDQIQNVFLNCGLEKSYPFGQGQTQRALQECVLCHFIYAEFCLLMTDLNVSSIFAIINIFNLALQAVAFY